MPAGGSYVFRAVLLCHLQLKVNVIVHLVELTACLINIRTEVIVYFVEIYKILVSVLTLIKMTLTNRDCPFHPHRLCETG